MKSAITICRKIIYYVAIFCANLPLANISLANDIIKIGVMLPATGTFADLGTAINNGFKLYLAEHGGVLANKKIELIYVDDESDPAKATENANKLIKRDNVDVLLGSVHSGVAMGMAKVARETDTLMLIPNAGANELTGALCAANIFRSSFSNWQNGYATGLFVGKRHKSVVTLTWKYTAGLQMVSGFNEAFAANGGKSLKDLSLAFPNAEFQAFLTEIAEIKPEAVFVFFSGAGGAKFVNDYMAAGLNKTIPLYATGDLTDVGLAAMQNNAQNLLTVLHYADGLKNKKNLAFEKAYALAYQGTNPTVFAVQGYDAAQMLHSGLRAVNGDISKKKELYQAIASANIDSPRGEFKLSRAHNPIQNYYLRKVIGKENVYQDLVVKSLADPAQACKM